MLTYKTPLHSNNNVDVNRQVNKGSALLENKIVYTNFNNFFPGLKDFNQNNFFGVKITDNGYKVIY